jgi:hypothetical protein
MPELVISHWVIFVVIAVAYVSEVFSARQSRVHLPTAQRRHSSGVGHLTLGQQQRQQRQLLDAVAPHRTLYDLLVSE